MILELNMLEMRMLNTSFMTSTKITQSHTNGKENFMLATP